MAVIDTVPHGRGLVCVRRCNRGGLPEGLHDPLEVDVADALPGDRICVDSRPGNTPKRGEIWVAATPIGWLAAKRVIGLPGETIEVAGGKVLIDGRPIAEPYLTGPITYS